MYPQDALQLVFELSQQFKQSYEFYQSILTTQKNRTFTEFATIIEQYDPNQSAMNHVISSYKKGLTGIKNAFLQTPSNGRIEGINRTA